MHSPLPRSPCPPQEREKASTRQDSPAAVDEPSARAVAPEPGTGDASTTVVIRRPEAAKPRPAKPAKHAPIMKAGTATVGLKGSRPPRKDTALPDKATKLATKAWRMLRQQQVRCKEPCSAFFICAVKLVLAVVALRLVVMVLSPLRVVHFLPPKRALIADAFVSVEAPQCAGWHGLVSLLLAAMVLLANSAANIALRGLSVSRKCADVVFSHLVAVQVVVAVVALLLVAMVLLSGWSNRQPLPAAV